MENANDDGESAIETEEEIKKIKNTYC